MSDNDRIQRFLFEQAGIRGEIVRLETSYQAVLEKHDYPAPVGRTLGQALAAVSLLSATLKFQGKLTLQIQGDGPVNFLLVQGSSEQTFRGLAHWKEDQTLEEGKLFGNGHLALTLEPDSGERYQGIIGLESGYLNQALEHYFEQSEQLPTRLWLVADEHRSVGLLLQDLPNDGEDDDAWERITHLANTVTDHELLNLSNQELLYRLFHEEKVRLFEADPVNFRCSCSRQKIEQTILSMGEKETLELLEEQGEIAVDCEFCNAHYVLDRVDVGRLFNPTVAAASPDRAQ